jgi:tryptophanyl-tRNA synthetase
MSKSYDNTIPLFDSRGQLKKAIFSIVTDSRAPGEAKDTEGSALFQLFQAFADAEETAAMRQAFIDGIGWGDAKQELFERIDAEVAPLREKYEQLIAHPARIEQQLRDGAQRLREKYATPRLQGLRESVGLRDLGKKYEGGRQAVRKSANDMQDLKRYRDKDGRFYSKLLENKVLLVTSKGADSHEAANQQLKAVIQAGVPALEECFIVEPGVEAAAVVSLLRRMHPAV